MGKLNRDPVDDETTIDMDLVVLKSVEKWLKLFKLWDGTSKFEPKQKVIQLESFFTRVYDPGHFDTFPGLEQSITTCEDGETEEEVGCGAEFHAWMECCPFCTGSPNPDEGEQKTDAEIVEYLLRVEGTKVKAPKKAPPSPIEPKVEEKPKAQPLGLVKPPAEDVEEEQEEDGDIEGTEIIPPQTNGTIATVEELDAAVERAVTTYAAAATNAYECAVELKEIHERQLWRQRRDDKGQPKYAHFNNFVEAELSTKGIGRVRAYGLIEMAKKFSRAEFNALGPAKMNVLVSMEEGPRKALAQETIQNNLPLAEVRERKEEIRATVSDRSDTSLGKGKGRSKPGPKPGKSSRKATPTPDAEQVFTVVFPSSTGSIECVASKGSPKKVRAAKSFDDLPVGEITGINGMKLRFALNQAKDGTVQVNYFLIRET